MSNITGNVIKDIDDLVSFDEESQKSLAGNRDQVMLQHILDMDKDSQKTQYVEYKKIDVDWAPTDKYKVMMLVPPAWSVLFPSYGVAKLVSLMRLYGYSVKSYDLNVESFHYVLKTYKRDYWLQARHYLWSISDNFHNFILPEIKPVLDPVIDEIINSDIRVVGFSLYVTNLFASIYMVKKIREARPDICILAGGPETITNEYTFLHGDCRNLFNYIFQGESEETLINLLENLPETLPMNEIVGSTNSRLKLEEYPYADFSDYAMSNYKERGVSMETSRGCIAQCSFCTETYFWKFRSQEPVRVAEEIEYYVKTYKVRRLWFVDSLANGNLKNFEKLIDLLLEKKLDVRWHTTARCDGRMDYIFIRKAVAAGCTALAFGVESGSQKVLNDMRKKVEVWEIEDNIRDCKKAGMWNHVTWMVGFPTEEAVDHFHSMQVFYNIRKWLACVTLGHTCLMAPNADIETNTRKYNIVNDGDKYNHQHVFLNLWYTDGYKNTIIHRFIRLKFAYIWLEILRNHRNSIIVNTQYEDSLHEHYTLEVGSPKNIPEYVPQDFNINFNQFEGFSGSIANEYIGICYTLYKYFNRCNFNLKLNPELDTKIFGNFLVREYTAEVDFNVDKRGNYTLTIDHKLSHSTREEYLKESYENERSKKDMSFEERIEKTGHISDWQTETPQPRLSVHEQDRKSVV